MKTNPGQILLGLLPFVAVIALRAADDVPKRPPFNRYDSMVQHSPFAVATALAAPAATPAVFKDLYIANAAHTAQADYLTILSAADKSFHEYVSTEGTNEHGFAVANIQWSDKQGETKATVSKDGQFSTLGFNQALMSQPSNVPAPMVPQNSGYTPGQSNIPRPPQVPSMATPPPHVRPVIPRNPNAIKQVPPNMNSNAANQ